MSTPAHLPHVPPPAARINTVQANFNVTAAQGKLSAPELLLAITRSQILPALSDLLESPPYSELVLTLAHVEIDLGRWPDDPNWPDVRHVLTQKLRAILDPHLQKTPQLVVQTVPALQASRTFKGHEIFAYILAKAPADQTGALNAALRDDSSLRAQAMANPKLATLLSKFTVRVLLESIDSYAPNHQLATLLAYVAANPVTLPDLMQALVDTPSQMAGLLAAARLQPGLIAQYGTLEQLLTKVAENPATLNTIAAQSRFLHNQTRVLAKKLLAQIPTHPKSLQIVRKFLSQYPALTNTLVALIADISLPKRIFSPQIKDIDTLLLYMTTALDKLHHSLNAATIVQVTFATHLNVQLTLSALAGLSPPKQFAYLLKLIATDPAALALLGQHDTTLDKTQLAASLRHALETAQQYTALAQSPAPVGKINNGQIPPKLILNDGTANQSNLQITYPSETPILRPKDSPKLCLDRSVSRHIWGLLRHFKEKSSTLILEKHDVGTHTVAELSDVLHRVFSASPDPESLPEAQQAKVKRKASSDADRNLLPTITPVQIRTILTQITHLAPPEQPAVLIALIAAHPATLSTLEQPETLTILSNLSPELQATITQFSAVTESDRRALLDRWNALPFSHNASNEIVRLLQTLEMNQRASDNHKARPAQQNSAEQIDSVLEMIANGQREPTVAALISPVSPDIDIPSLAAQPTSALTPVQIRTILTQITHLAPPEQPAVLIALIAAHPATLSTLEQPETLTILSNLSPELQATIAQFSAVTESDRRALLDRWNALPFSHNASNEIVRLLQTLEMNQRASDNHKARPAQQNSAEQIDSVLEMIANGQREPTVAAFISPVSPDIDIPSLAAQPTSALTPVQIRTILTQITHLAPPEQPAVLIALIAAHPATLSTLEQPETLTILSNLSPELQATIAQFDQTQRHDTPLLHLQRMMRTQPYHNIRTALNWIKQAAQGWPDLLAQIAPTPPEWLSVLLTDDAPTPSLPAQIITAQRDLHAYLLNVGTETDTAHETAARISALWALLTTTKSQQANTQDTDLTALWTSAPFEIVSRLIALPNKTKQLQFLEAAGLDWGSVLRQEAVSRTALSTLWKTNRAAMLAAIRWITPSEQSALLNRLLPEGATLLHNALTLMLSITAAPEVVMRRAITALLDGTSMDLEAFSRQSKLIVSPQVVLMKAFGIGGAIIEPLATRDLDLDLDLDQTTPDMPPQLLAMLPQMIDIIVPRRVQQTFITFYSAWPSASLVTKPNPALTRLAEMSDQPAPVLNALLAEVLHPITDETDIHSQITRLIVTLEPDTFRRDAHLRLVVARLTTVSPSSDPDTRALRNAARTAAQHILNQKLNAEQPVQLTPYTPTTLWDTEAAGLVIFHPYIGLLFNRLGVKPVEKQLPLSLIPRAIAILEALCGSPHSSDPLYNVLLGRHPDATTPLKPVTLHDDDMTLIVSLTRSVIARWGKLGATSPEGLQATFINRTASLELRDDSVILNVSMGPYDMLLDNLPWPLSPIALSWMPHPLHVNWRNEHV